jgi:hypothetical protein
MRNENKLPNWVLAMCLIPIVMYGCILQTFWLNIPYFDDHALKAFILNFEKANNFSDKFQEIIRQHNEHRIGLTRFVSLLTYWIHGSLDYRWLMAFGNTALLSLTWLFFQVFRDFKFQRGSNHPHPWWVFIPVPFLIFSLSNWENMFWGMASVQNLWVIALSLWILYWLSQADQRHFYKACVLSVIVVFTSGNGFLALGIGLGILILKKDFRRSIIWGILLATWLYIYFHEYQKNQANPGISATKWQWFSGYLSFGGSLIQISTSSDYSKMIKWPRRLGLLLNIFSFVAILGFILKSKLLFRPNSIIKKPSASFQYFLLGMAIWLVANAALVTWGRIGFGVEVLLTSRYKIYSICWVIWLYLLLQNEIKHRLIKGQWIVLLVMIWLPNDRFYQEIVFHRNRLIAYDFVAAYSPQTGQRLTDSRVPYVPEKQIYDGRFQEIYGPMKLAAAQPIVYQKTETKDGLSMTFPTWKAPVDSQKDALFLVLQSTKSTQIYPTKFSKNRWSFITFNYFKDQPIAQVNKQEVFTAGTYRLGLVHFDFGKNSIKVYPLKDSTAVLSQNKINVNW